ncbi:hypothetical protein ACFUMH_07240 [Cellulomonas sp. NPDC057328]|uniref:hypothetical protein n=1 Tax=Cellulomonas sp. NPDC057328 TaxID=3346101 RepID=UPI0036310564
MSTKKIWTRTLGVAGVTGGLVLLSAAASQAAEGPLGGLGDGLLGGTQVSQSHDASSDTTQDASQAAGDAAGAAAVQAPVTLGGVELGLTTSSSQSSGSSSTVTDADGASVEQSQEQSSSDATNLGVDLGAITLDPAAMLEGAASGATSSTDGAQDASAAEGTAAGAAAVQAPVAIEGLAVTGSHEQQQAQESERTVTTEDGATSTTGSASQSQSATSGGLVLEEITADPAAALSGVVSGGAAGTEGATDASSAEGTLAGAVDAAAPVRVGGLSGGFDDARSSERATWREVTDEDGDTTGSRTEQAEATRTGGAFSTGALTAEPAAALAGALSGEAARLDGRDEVATESTDVRGLLDLAAPFHADGLTAEGWAERATAQRTDRWTTTEGGTARTSTWSQRADAVHPAFATGPVDGDVLGWAWGRVNQQAATAQR